MENSKNGNKIFGSPTHLFRGIGSHYVVLLFLMIGIPSLSQAQMQQHAKPAVPEPAVAAIIAAFDKYEVVAMPEAHGMKDMDDFILSLVRTPALWEKVNDIEVECGNSLYQPLLDRYIAGEDVSFEEAQKVWRNTTQPMCGSSGFFEQFFPLVRAINQKLPAEKRLRVLAGDPPVDWDKIKDPQSSKAVPSRDDTIASVMEKEVLSKHRKALMLFGTLHLMHGVQRSSVAAYEKTYPNVTFVISELGIFDTGLSDLARSPFAAWPVPSLTRTKGTWLGAMDLTHFLPPPIMIDQDCNVHNQFPVDMQKPMAELVDGLLYLGPQDLRLKEQLPADIALDVDYMTEMQRRAAVMPGYLGTTIGSTRPLKDIDQQIVNSAKNQLFAIPKMPDPKIAAQSCLDRKNKTIAPKSDATNK